VTRGDFAEAIFTYCVLTGGSEIGGRRTEKRNALKSGVQHSAHLVKLASDVVYDTDIPFEVRSSWARRLGLKLIVEDDHDHLEPYDWQPG
jgi:hypothetical protein